MKGLLATTCAALGLLPTAVHAGTPELLVAAASDLVFCMEEINAGFAKKHPHVVVKTSTGSSGNFFAQIRSGAPFDVFLSADKGYAQALVDANLAEKKSLTLYAHGHIVLWTLREDIDMERGLTALEEPRVKKIALANPAHAPYGRAAIAALESQGLAEKLRGKLVFGENISQATQFVATGHADVGIVALSLVNVPAMSGKGRSVEIPQKDYPVMEQWAVITTRGASHPHAQAYLDYLQSEEAQEIFARHGLRLSE